MSQSSCGEIIKYRRKTDLTAFTEIFTFPLTKRDRYVISNSKIDGKFLKWDIFQIWLLIDMIVFTVRLTRSFTLLHKSSSYIRKYSLAVNTSLDAKLSQRNNIKCANCVEMQSPINLPLSA